MSAYVLDARCNQPQPEWVSIIASELDLVDCKLEATVTSDVPVAFDLSIHLFSAGGKRIRPVLVILSALASGSMIDSERIINLAAATELVHTASLVHDDVIDETKERRGVATANDEWGNKLSVLGGDFLLSKGFSLLASDGDAEILHVLSSTAVKMTESEILQAASEGSLASWEREYWRIIDGKTAAFMGACCECGAIIAGADPDLRRAFAEYGTQVGLAFQITDDLLDIAGDPAQTGKDIGTDLTNGKFTLPVLLALQKLEGNDRRDLLSSVQSESLTREDAHRIAKLVVKCGAVEMAREVALDHARNACKQLSAVHPSEYKNALEALASSVIDRYV